MKICTIGGATVDVFLQTTGADLMKIVRQSAETHYMLFESGEKIVVGGIEHHPGGGASNSAVSFARQGFDVATICKVGADTHGESIKRNLEHEGVAINCIATSAQHPSGSSYVIHNVEHDRIIFTYRGANGTLTREDLTNAAIADANYIYITSISTGQQNLLGFVIDQAREHQIPIAINPGASQLCHGAHELRDALKHTQMLILNASEAKRLMHALVEADDRYEQLLCAERIEPCRFADEQVSDPYLIQHPVAYEQFFFSIRRFFRELQHIGLEIIVITNGANGVYVAQGHDIWFHPSIQTTVVDTVGAGDAFGSTFVGSIALDMPVQRALVRGMINSSSVIGVVGAQPGLMTQDQLTIAEKKCGTALLQRHPL